MVDDSPIAKYFAKSLPGLRQPIAFGGTDSGYGIMLRKENSELPDIRNSLADHESQQGVIPITVPPLGQSKRGIPLVDLSIAEGKLTLHVRGADKLWAFKSSLEIPLAHIAGVQAEPEAAHGWYHGIRMPGTNVPA